VRIVDSARKHGIADEDIWHAIRSAVQSKQAVEFVLLIGPARSGLMLEIGLARRADETLVIHAMPLRPSLRRREKR
jgi:hypothetical protein